MKNILLSFCWVLLIVNYSVGQSVNIDTDPIQCDGAVIYFSYIPSGLTEPISCLWDFGDGATSTMCNPDYSYVDQGTYTACVLLTDANNINVQDCMDVSVLASPLVEIILSEGSGIANNDSIICEGEGITLEAQGSAGIYEWEGQNLDNTNGQIVTANNLSTGTYDYIVTITDTNGCTNTASTTVIVLPLPTLVNTVITDATCGEGNGAVEITLTNNDSGNYSYLLSTGQLINGDNQINFTDLSPGDYIVFIIDNNTGCEIDVTFTISDVPIIASITITNINDVTCNGGNDGIVEYEVTPTTNLTSHIESSTNGNIYNNGSLPADSYCIIATDLNGCISGMECFDITEPAALNLTGNTNALFCPGESVTLVVNETFDFYQWSDGSNAPSIVVSDITATYTYTITVTNTNGCTASLEYNIAEADDCVWAGDANYDGIANNQDVLFLGMAYGNTGQIRDNATINWEGQLAEFEWDSIFNTGINQKHADSDGNGIVEQDDTLAIVQNYNLAAHELREMAGGGFPLYVNFDGESEDYGERIELKIDLGDVVQSVPGAYGIAFSLTFNYPEVINPSTIQIDFSNSVLGEEEELITLSKILLEQGRMDFAITRFDHMDMTDLYGELMSLSFIIEDNIDGFTSTNYTLEANPVDVLCIHSWGEEITITGNNGNILMLGSSATTSLPTVDSGVNYYPNPTKDELHINMQDNSMIQQIRVFDTLGKLVAEKKGNDILSIYTNHWTQGIYFLEITNNEGKQYLFKVLKE